MEEEADLKLKKAKLPKKIASRGNLDGSIIEHLEKKRPKTAAAMNKATTKTKTDSSGKSKSSTRVMVNKALEDMKSRKGSSLHAIKKYVSEQYCVDTEKMGHLIKKYLKTAVEKGIIVQTKGSGASGSFKPAADKKKKEKKLEKKTDEDAKKTKSKTKAKKDSSEKTKDTTKKTVKSEKEVKEKGEKTKSTKVKKETGEKKKVSKSDKSPKKKIKVPTSRRRKSVGSIVKPPKMKPKTPMKPKAKTVKKQKADV